MKKFEDFSADERRKIAEFIYSWEHEILIKPDALDCLSIMRSHELIDLATHIDLRNRINNGHYSPVEEIVEILFSTIDEDSGKRIMKEYYS